MTKYFIVKKQSDSFDENLIDGGFDTRIGKFGKVENDHPKH